MELVALFSLNEIRSLVFVCDRNKSPGPDDFSIAFFQDNQDIIKDDLVRGR